jgi:hypothetical protein
MSQSHIKLEKYLHKYKNAANSFDKSKYEKKIKFYEKKMGGAGLFDNPIDLKSPIELKICLKQKQECTKDLENRKNEIAQQRKLHENNLITKNKQHKKELEKLQNEIKQLKQQHEIEENRIFESCKDMTEKINEHWKSIVGRVEKMLDDQDNVARKYHKETISLNNELSDCKIKMIQVEKDIEQVKKFTELVRQILGPEKFTELVKQIE